MSNENAPLTMRALRNVLIRWAVVLSAIGVFAIWGTCRMSTTANRLPALGNFAMPMSQSDEPAIDYWTCTMHPKVQLPESGDCSICGMELVPKYVGSDEPGVRPVSVFAMPATSPHTHPHGETTGGERESKAWYRCTMPECGDQGSGDPESRCPVCGMKRERVDTGGEDIGDLDIQLSERAQRLAEVETELVEPRLLYKRIRTVGRVGYDETRYKMASAWINGRIDKLFADFTGMTVSQGDHLVAIYSPELLSAQEEYLQALRAVAASRSTQAAHSTQTAISRRSSEQMLHSAKRKLELLGVTDTQIQAVESSGEPQTHLVVHAPIGGTIIEKHVMEGMYVKTGDPLYTIADLTHLWLLVDLYEADLPWVKSSQEVQVTTRSIPGEVFTGEIVFIDPRVNPKTRTVQIRIHVENPSLILKPDMWVAAQIEAGLAHSGQGAVPTPSGAFACPMHTWKTANKPDICPICEMDMVRVEDLVLYRMPSDAAPVLSAPRDAVMQTGQRALVYIQTAPGTYRGMEVTVGPLARGEDDREYYPILAGLSGGERVVIRGNFAIDSQMQLAGKPSLFVASGFGDRGSVSQSVHASGQDAPGTEGNDGAKQTHCPVMGGKINSDVFIEYKGEKVYFCCWGCDSKFQAEPEKYIPKLPMVMQKRILAAQDFAGDAKQTICPVMGNKIDLEVFTDYRGVRLYFFCAPCIDKFTNDPDSYIRKLPAQVREKLTKPITEEAGDD